MAMPRTVRVDVPGFHAYATTFDEPPSKSQVEYFQEREHAVTRFARIGLETYWGQHTITFETTWQANLLAMCPLWGTLLADFVRWVLS